MSKKRMSKKLIQRISQKRIHTLFSLAKSQIKQGNISLANRYIEHARKISMKQLSPIPQTLKQQYCKYCYAYLYPGVTCQVRIHHGKRVIQCFRCQNTIRIPFK